MLSYDANFDNVHTGPDVRGPVIIKQPDGLQTVAMSELVLVVFMSVLMDAREDVTDRRCVDLRLRKVLHKVDSPQLPGCSILATSFARPTGFLSRCRRP